MKVTLEMDLSVLNGMRNYLEIQRRIKKGSLERQEKYPSYKDDEEAQTRHLTSLKRDVELLDKIHEELK